MKYLITILLLINTVNAAVSKSSGKNSINDLMYMPDNDVNYISGGLKIYSQENISKQALTGTTVSTLEVDTINAHVTYGRNIIDNLFLTGSINYDLDSDNTTTTSGATQKSNSNGISDPTIEVKYRALTEEKDKIIFDYKLALSPKLGKSDVASTTRDGNNLRGGTETRLAVEIGRKLTTYSLSLEASFTYTGELEVTNLVDNTLTRVKNKMDYVVTFKGQYHFNEDVFLRGAFSFNSLGDYDEKAHSATSIVTYDTSVTLNFTLGYVLNTNTLLNLEYMINNANREVSRVGNLTDQDINTSSINAYVQYQF
jgi:hypothetical protein